MLPSTETETWTFSDVWFSADHLELSFPACVCHFFQHHGKASAPPLPLPTLKSTLSLDLSFKFYDAGGDSPLSNAYSVSVLSLSLSLSLSVSGLDLLPGSCPLPCTWQNASPVWIIYIFLWSCQKSGITSFYIRIWPWKGASRVTVRCNDTPSTIFKFFHGFHFIYFYHKV